MREEASVSGASLPTIGFMGFLSIADTAFIAPVISAYSILLGASPFHASLIAALYSMVAIPSSILSGFVVDRLGRRPCLTAGLIIDAVIMLAYSFSINYIMLGAVRALHAVADSLIVPSIIATIGDVYHGRRGKPVGVFWTFTAIGIIIGSGTSSIIVSRMGFPWVFITLTTLMLIGFIISFKAWPNIKGRRTPRQLTKLAKNIRTILSAVLPMFSIYIVIGTIVGSLSTALIMYYGFEERLAASQVGLYMALSVSVSIPFFYLSARLSDTRGARAALMIGLVSSIAASLTLTPGSGLPQRKISSILFGAALRFVFVGSPIPITGLPSDVRGAGAGSHQSVSLLGVALGAPLSGALLQAHGPSTPFTAAAIPALITLTYLAGKTKK